MAETRNESATPNPALVMDTMSGYQRAAALNTAIELDLFTLIGEGADTVEALATGAHASARGIRILSDYMTILGFLSKDAGRYKLTPTSAVFLNRKSPACFGSSARFLNSPMLHSYFSDLTETVKRGTVASQGTTQKEFNGWVTFAESMEQMAAPAAEFIAGIAAHNGKMPRKVLDIAAGHGRFGIAIARKAPQAEIFALDWPNVLPVAQRNAQKAGVTDRYKVLPGDAFNVDFGSGYDLVLLTNFLHHFDKPTNESLLKKVYAALNPGGRAITLEFVPNADRVSPPGTAGFSLVMLASTPSGDAYTLQEYERMFGSAGFDRSELLQIPDSPEQVIVSTKKT